MPSRLWLGILLTLDSVDPLERGQDLAFGLFLLFNTLLFPPNLFTLLTVTISFFLIKIKNLFITL